MWKETELNEHSSIHDFTVRLLSDLQMKLDDYIIEGLKRKGFEFENKTDLENFIKKRCECKDNLSFKERIYYADNIPFFLHKYEMIYEQITKDNNGVNMYANYGSYTYL